MINQVHAVTSKQFARLSVEKIPIITIEQLYSFLGGKQHTRGLNYAKFSHKPLISIDFI